MKKFVLTAAFAGLLSACAQPPVPLNTTFDAAHADKLLAEGTGKISGNALIRQVGGGVVTCAGNEVDLIPATEHANERIGILYGSRALTGAVASYNGSTLVDLPSDEQYRAKMKTTVCDAQGNFEFDKLSAGAFFIKTNVHWSVSTGYYMQQQGATMVKKVQLKDGETVKVVISR